MNEFIFDLRRNWLAIATKAVIVVLFLTGLYSTISFSASTQNAIIKSFSDGNNQDLYRVTDTFIDANEFTEVRQSPEKLDQIGEFYEKLNESKLVNLLSSFNQPIPIADFKGSESFDAWAGGDYVNGGVYVDQLTGRETLEVRSMQMSKEAFEFSHLTVDEGQLPDWENIDYSSGQIPVLLGADYRGIYSVNDTLDGMFYMEPFSLKVVGFLEPHSSMFYQDDIDHFLDDTIVIPYPKTLRGIAKTNLDFRGILSFAMINSDFTASKDMSGNDILKHLDQIGRETGFTNYALIGVPQYLTQYSLMRTMLFDNVWLVAFLQVALGIVGGLVLCALSAFNYRRRRTVLNLRWIIGTSCLELQKWMGKIVLIEWAVIGLLFLTVYQVLPNEGSSAVGWIILIFAVAACVDIAAATRSTKLYFQRKIA